MNEQDFDNRIKESALKQEMQSGAPLWDKNGTWKKIESGLDKPNRAIWWKIAAILVLFFSIGMSYAQWLKFKDFRNEKETELNNLKQQINDFAENEQTWKANTEALLLEKNAAIDNLKKQIVLFRTTGQSKEIKEENQIQSRLTEVLQKQKNEQKINDSLRNTIEQLQATVQILAKSQKLEEPANIEQKPKILEKEITPERRIYYISNEVQMPTKKTKRGLKIELFGSPDNPEVEYQSDYSIFKKQ